MARMPSIFIPHGGGPSFFMTGERKIQYQPTEDFLRSVQHLLPEKPKTILIITAHWETRTPSFTGGTNPGLIFDYFGFPPETYELTYPALGSPSLAQRAADLLKEAGLPALVETDYGWDHGVFIPLKVMYPEADVPVVAMSLHESLNPELHAHFGRALAPLRDEGVLIVGSGMSYELSQLASLYGLRARVVCFSRLDRPSGTRFVARTLRPTRQLARSTRGPSLAPKGGAFAALDGGKRCGL